MRYSDQRETIPSLRENSHGSRFFQSPADDKFCESCRPDGTLRGRCARHQRLSASKSTASTSGVVKLVTHHQRHVADVARFDALDDIQINIRVVKTVIVQVEIDSARVLRRAIRNLFLKKHFNVKFFSFYSDFGQMGL